MDTISQQDIWNDPNRSRKLMQRKQELQDFLGAWRRIRQLSTDIQEYFDIYALEQDSQYLSTIEEEIATLTKDLRAFNTMLQFQDELDDSPAIMEIHPGAGGTESQDWANMLLRMYVRWTERHNFHHETIDVQAGEEAGIKSAILRVTGKYAFGRLKGEKGIHRLVRISPFDANKRRHTSFASVDVLPDIDETIEVNIEDKDLKIDTFRSSGAGGQHVNVTDSAVRITHRPTGIVVSCQNERSQHRNKDTAMKILKARLYRHLKEKQDKEFEKMHGEKKDIAWGNQIRSYVLAPYQLIKDHRTNEETSNVQRVLDGDIDPFIEAFLLHSVSQT